MKPIKKGDLPILRKMEKMGWAKIRKYQGKPAWILTKKGHLAFKKAQVWMRDIWKVAPEEWKMIVERKPE